jgi:hypothetical protein
MGGFILGLLGGISTATSAAINWLIGAVAALAGGEIVLSKAIGDEAELELTKWAQLIKYLTLTWLLGIEGLIAKILAAIQRLHDWLKRHIQPIIDFLKYWRAWFDRFYRLHILPIINLIQRIRRFLLILRLLHIHFADALDKWLQKYEATLNKVFLTIHGTLNQLIGWASLASSPIGLGRLVLVSVTGRRMVGALTRAITSLPIGHFFPSTSSSAFAFERQPVTAADYTSEVTNPPASAIIAPLLSFLGPGEYDDQVGATDADIDAAEAIPWGGEFIANVIAHEDYLNSLVGDNLSLKQAIETSGGILYSGTKDAAAILVSMLG